MKTRAEAQRLLSINPGGLVYIAYDSRYYSKTGLAPQAVGFTQFITPEQLNQYRRLGYNGSEKVGQSGIEKWARIIWPVSTAAPCVVARMGRSSPRWGRAVHNLRLGLPDPRQQHAKLCPVCN